MPLTAPLAIEQNDVSTRSEPVFAIKTEINWLDPIVLSEYQETFADRCSLVTQWFDAVESVPESINSEQIINVASLPLDSLPSFSNCNASHKEEHKSISQQFLEPVNLKRDELSHFNLYVIFFLQYLAFIVHIVISFPFRKKNTNV